MNLRRTLFLLALGCSFAPAPAFAQDDGTLAPLKKDLFFLAGPECQGRGTGQEGNDKAAAYIAESFKKVGLQPAGTDGYFQPFAFGGSKVQQPTTLKLAGPDGQALTFKLGYGFNVVGVSGPGKASAPLVFVGYGITAEKLKYDDYAGLDVKGKIVVMLRRSPRAESKDKPFDKDENSPFATLNFKADEAVKRGAAGII
ncbi:MAG: M20/M25/M40 family metallo-hydrolase, partial [Gemmataceae bacterium]